MKSLISKGFVFVLFCFVTLFASADDVAVAKVDAVDFQKQQIFMGDQFFYFTSFVIVQNYKENQAEQRLPISKVKKGNWIIVHYSYDGHAKKNMLNKIELVASDALGQSLYENQ